MVELNRLFGSSSYTLKANIWAQFSGVIIMLTIPNILSVEDYAKVVYFTFLLSFVSLYDLGLVAVYNRLIPGLVVRNTKKVQEIESALIRYIIFMSVIFGAMISFVYYNKYSSIIESSLIFIYLPVFLIVSFSIVRDIVREDYQTYYYNIRFQSIIKLTQVPLIYAFSIVGWFISGLIVYALLFLRVFKRDIFKANYNFSFIKDNLKEGVELSAKTFVWLQMLSFPRTYASINYSDELIAQYGLVNTIYQAVVSLSLAVFVPVTVKTFKLFSKSDRLAYFYLKKVLKNTMPLFFVGTVLLILTLPEIISIAFPKYNIPFGMIAGYFGTVMFLPLFFIFGNILAAKKEHNAMTIILVIWISLLYMCICCTNIISISSGFFIMLLFSTLSLYVNIKLKQKRAIHLTLNP